MRTLLPFVIAGCTGASPVSTFPTIDSAIHESGTPPTPPPTTTQGACGDVTVWHLTLTGTVLGADGNLAPGVTVRVEDRGWEPGTIVGESTTDAYGAFTLDLAEVTSVEDCWATLLDYVLVGERTGERGEKDLNSELFNAIEGGTLEADLGSFPLRLESQP